MTAAIEKYVRKVARFILKSAVGTVRRLIKSDKHSRLKVGVPLTR